MEARGVPVDVVFADASSSGGSLNVDIDDKGSSSVGNSDSRDNGTAAEVETKKRPRERLWATALAALVAAVPALLVGYTIGFPSSALLDLTGDPAAGIPSDYVFSSTLADVFAVNQSTFTFDLEDFYDFFNAGSGTGRWGVWRIDCGSNSGQMGPQKRAGSVRHSLLCWVSGPELCSLPSNRREFQDDSAVGEVSDWSWYGLGLHVCISEFQLHSLFQGTK